MSYKGPAVATGKDLSFVIAASGDGSTGAYAGSSNAATALKSVNSTETYMKVNGIGQATQLITLLIIMEPSKI